MTKAVVQNIGWNVKHREKLHRKLRICIIYQTRGCTTTMSCTRVRYVITVKVVIE